MEREWGDLDLKVKLFMLKEQENQGNKRNPEVFIKNIYCGEYKGGFNWHISSLGKTLIYDYINNNNEDILSKIEITDFPVTAQEVIEHFPYLKECIEEGCREAGYFERHENYSELYSLFPWGDSMLGHDLCYELSNRKWNKAKVEIKKLFEDDTSRFTNFMGKNLSITDFQFFIRDINFTGGLNEDGTFTYFIPTKTIVPESEREAFNKALSETTTDEFKWESDGLGRIGVEAGHETFNLVLSKTFDKKYLPQNRLKPKKKKRELTKYLLTF